jgi:hypothetical protein
MGTRQRIQMLTIAALQNPFPKFSPPFPLMILLDRCRQEFSKNNFTRRRRNSSREKKGAKLAIYHLISGGNSRNKILSDRGEKAQRDIDIHTACRSPGDTLKEIADYSGIHYTGGNAITQIVLSKKLIFQGLPCGPL